MNDEYRQQALDNFRNALARLEQSDFEIVYVSGGHSTNIYIWGAVFNPDTEEVLSTISNHILRLKKDK
jgi:hypothetical protein